MNKSVIVNVKQVGFHRWPDAPERRAYLRDKHRHVFTFRVEVGVLHTDRDVEFHTLQDDITGWLADLYPWDGAAPPFGYDFGTRSCEQLAVELEGKLREEGRYRVLSIEVWEDDENGGRVVFT